MVAEYSHIYIIPIFLYCSTIKQHVLEAKEILGERLYNDLDHMICDLMDGTRFYPSAMLMRGPLVASGGVRKKGTLNEDQLDCRHRLPPFTGKYYHEIFGLGRGDYTK